jgi:hypothetical protein
MIARVDIKQWMDSNVQNHTILGEVNMTTLGEDCAESFGVLTELGDSDDEVIIFEIASEYFSG